MSLLNKWTPEEDEQLLTQYKAGKHLNEISLSLSRSENAVRNRLYLLRGGKEKKGVSVTVSMTSKEYDEMREAKSKLTEAQWKIQNFSNTEIFLLTLVETVQELVEAKKLHRNTSKSFNKLVELMENYKEDN